MKKFRSKVFTLSQSTIKKIDKMIEEGVGYYLIHKNLVNNHKEEIGTLSKNTLREYVEYVKNGRMGKPDKTDKSIEVLEKECNEIETEKSLLESTAITDKGAYVDLLIFKVNKKLAWLDRLDSLSGGRLDIKRENVYIKYIDMAKELIEFKAKLGGEIDDGNSIIVNILNTHMGWFQRVVYDSLKEVCPEKLIEFQEVYKRKYLETKKEMFGEGTVELPKKIN